jgi:hypothetical protein
MANHLIPLSVKLERHTKDENGCWVWSANKDRDGYGVLTHHRKKQLRAHRASYEFYKGAIPDGAFVCHSCDNPSCINPDHLFIGSPKDNTQDMIRKGRKGTLLGSVHGMAKLTEEDVTGIRAAREKGELLASIATRYGISFQHVSLIARNKSWRHV